MTRPFGREPRPTRFDGCEHPSVACPDQRHSLKLPAGKSILMLGTDPSTRGGIAAVINTYQSGGLFNRVAVTLVATHQDGARIAKLRRYCLAFVDVFRQLNANGVAVVHAHVSSGPSFWRKSLLLLLARRFGIPTVFHLHSGGFGQWVNQAAWSSPVRRWWVRHTFESSDAVIVLSRSWKKWANDFAPRAHVTVIGNPVQVPAIKPTADGRGVQFGAGRVLFLGWIYDFKGVYDLLQAWVLFRRRCPGWRLVVGGKGEVDKFLAEADRLCVRKDLDFLGWVSGDEKERELRRADIFVLPSYQEGMPVSVLEAMAFGAAVIATPVGGVPDMMEQDVHGLWVQAGDVQGICDRLVELASSAELRDRLSQAAFAHVTEHNSVEVSIVELLKLYGSLV